MKGAYNSISTIVCKIKNLLLLHPRSIIVEFIFEIFPLWVAKFTQQLVIIKYTPEVKCPQYTVVAIKKTGWLKLFFKISDYIFAKVWCMKGIKTCTHWIVKPRGKQKSFHFYLSWKRHVLMHFCCFRLSLACRILSIIVPIVDSILSKPTSWIVFNQLTNIKNLLNKWFAYFNVL